MTLPLRLRLLLLPAAAAAAAAQQAPTLYDQLNGLSFRNPAGNATSRSTDAVTHREQCVLYSEIDNVTSVNKVSVRIPSLAPPCSLYAVY